MKKRIRSIGLVLLVLLVVPIWNNNRQEDDIHVFDTTAKPYKVVIDPGHGGRDVGAIGTSGLYEKDFTFSLAQKVSETLEKEENIQVLMTREDDTFISSEGRYRPKFANEQNADLYISIHGNTFSSAKVSGTESYYYNRGSKNFAELMHKHVVRATGFRDRGVMKKDLFVVRETDMPSVLLEIGYLSNPLEEQQMLNDQFQYTVAEAISNGVKEYLGI